MAFAGVTSRICGIEIVDRRQIARHHGLSRIAAGSERVICVGDVQGVRHEIMQRNHALHHRCERLGNLRLAHVSDVPRTADFQVMNFGAKRFAHLTGVAGKIDQHPVRVHRIHSKAVRAEPACDGLQILLGGSEPFAELRGRDPLMIIGRFRVLQAFQELLRRRFHFHRPLQLQQQVIELQAVAHLPTIVFRCGFRPDVAAETDHSRFVHLTGNGRRHGRRT